MLRIALLVLLLANLAFFAWARWLAPADPDMGVSAPLAVPKVTLVGEIDAASSAALRQAPRCVSVGPFATAEEAEAAASLLGQSAVGSRQRAEAARVPDGWWVYVGGFASAADLMVALRRLRRAGLTDAEAMPASPEGRRISAGIFADRERADGVAARLRQLALEPTIAARTREAQRFWVDLDLPAAAADLSPEALGSGAPGAQLEIKDCALPAATEVAAPSPAHTPAAADAVPRPDRPAAGTARGAPITDPIA